MLRPDHTLREHLVYGFPGVGHWERSGVFPKREVTPVEKGGPLEGAAKHNEDLLLACAEGKMTLLSRKRAGWMLMEDLQPNRRHMTDCQAP